MTTALRRSGRTTRMLTEAARLDAAGRAVYVVTADEAQRRRLAAEFEREHGVTGVKFETEASLGAAWDWKRLRIRGAHPNCVVLVDHHAIEQHFGAMLDMLHRFDPGVSENTVPGAAESAAHASDAP